MLTLFSIIFLAIALSSLQIYFSHPNFSWIRLHLLLERRWFILLLLYFVVLTFHLLLTGSVGSGVGVFDGLISTIYCAEDDSNINSNAFTVPKITDNNKVHVELTSDKITAFSGAIQATANAVNGFKFAAAIAATGVATGTILKTLPPGAPKASLALALPVLAATTGLFSQLISKNYKTEKSTNISIVKPTSPGINSDTLTNLDDKSINSPLEILNLFDGLALVIILYTLVAVYCLLAFTVSFLIKELNLESKPFMINRPLLAKFIKSYTSTNRIVNYLLLALTWFALLGALAAAIYLRVHLPTDL
jgi:hypothetical protein